MAYILRRTDHGGYISGIDANGERSYTNSAIKARRYGTLDEAVADSCVENEIPVDLLELTGLRDW